MDRRSLYYKLSNQPKGSGELKKGYSVMITIYDKLTYKKHVSIEYANSRTKSDACIDE